MKVLSEAAIETLAGTVAYQKGLEYYNEGKVSKLKIDKGLITAEVTGTDIYTVELRHTAKIFEGSCSCPASDHFDFCKHCVATSLSYYYQTQSNQEISRESKTDTLEHHLNTLTKPQLADELLAVIKQDKQLQEIWQLRAELATGQLQAKDIRKQITKALPFKPSGIWRFHDVASYFSTSEQRIRALCSAISRLPAAQAFKLLTYAYERLEKTLHTVDDSGGYRYSLLDVLEKEVSKSFTSPEIDSQQRINLSASLFTNEKYTYELLRDESKLIALLTDDEHRGLIKALNEYWHELPSPNTDDLYKSTPFLRVEQVLLNEAKLTGDSAGEIEILTKGAVTVTRCLELVNRCLELDNLDEANKWLTYVSQLANLRVSDISAIEHTQIKIWLAEGNFTAAIKAQWSVFLEEESLSSIKELVASAKLNNERARWLGKCITYLQARMLDQESTPRNLERCETLVALYLQEGRQNEASGLALRFKLKPGTLMAIVNHAERLGSNELTIAERACNFLIAFGNHETNSRAIAFLNKIEQRFANDQKAFRALINTIYERPENKRKINFTKELKKEFGNLIITTKT